MAAAAAGVAAGWAEAGADRAVCSLTTWRQISPIGGRGRVRVASTSDGCTPYDGAMRRACSLMRPACANRRLARASSVVLPEYGDAWHSWGAEATSLEACGSAPSRGSAPPMSPPAFAPAAG